VALSSTRGRGHSPSWYSTQLFNFAVKNGQRVTVYAPDGRPIFRGYVCGGDAYSWGLVATDGEVRTFHKTSSFMIGFGQDGDLAREPEDVRALVLPKVARHRQWVLAEVFKIPPQDAPRDMDTG
jgi:hypothetical protein